MVFLHYNGHVFPLDTTIIFLKDENLLRLDNIEVPCKGTGSKLLNRILEILTKTHGVYEILSDNDGPYVVPFKCGKKVSVTIPSFDEVSYRLVVSNCDEDYKTFSFSENEDENVLMRDWIDVNLQHGNIHAWCNIQVTAEYRGLIEPIFAMNKNFESLEEVESNLFPDLKQDAYNSLIERIMSLR